LSEKVNSIDFLNKHIDKLDFNWLCHNPNAISILEKNMNRSLDWGNLNSNPNAIRLLSNNVDCIIWEIDLQCNPNCIYLIMYLIENNLMHYEREYFDDDNNYFYYENKDYWFSIFDEYNIDNIILIEKLETHSNTISKKIMKDYMIFKKFYNEYLNFNTIFRYKDIFEIDYEKIKDRVGIFKKELIMKSCHPYFVNKSLLKYNYLDC
jgi:hypothetical protein